MRCQIDRFTLVRGATIRDGRRKFLTVRVDGHVPTIEAMVRAKEAGIIFGRGASVTVTRNTGADQEGEIIFAGGTSDALAAKISHFMAGGMS